MTEFTDRDRDLIETTHDVVMHLQTLIENGEGSILSRLSDVCNEHNKLRNRFTLFVGILVGSSILGGGAYGLIELLK